MIQTKAVCDNKHAYSHRYEERDSEISKAIEGKWWQIELNPGTVVISQPVNETQFSLTAKHACCSSCAQQIIKDWALQYIAEEVAVEKSGEA